MTDDPKANAENQPSQQPTFPVTESERHIEKSIPHDVPARFSEDAPPAPLECEKTGQIKPDGNP